MTERTCETCGATLDKTRRLAWCPPCNEARKEHSRILRVMRDHGLTTLAELAERVADLIHPGEGILVFKDPLKYGPSPEFAIRYRKK